jgi:hypothetical protein
MGKSDGRNRLCLTIGRTVAILFRFQRPHFGFQSGDAISLHLDRFHQAIDDGMQIMIARVGKAYRQLSRSPAHKVEFWFVREHVSLYGSRCKKATMSYSIVGYSTPKAVWAGAIDSTNPSPAHGARLIG